VLECVVCVSDSNFVHCCDVLVTCIELDADCMGRNSFDARPSKFGKHRVGNRGESLDSSDEVTRRENEGHDGCGCIIF
jgi:hypothetical protein